MLGYHSSVYLGSCAFGPCTGMTSLSVYRPCNCKAILSPGTGPVNHVFSYTRNAFFWIERIRSC